MNENQSIYDIQTNNDFELFLKNVLISIATKFDMEIYQIWKNNCNLTKDELIKASAHVRANPLSSILFLQNLGFMPIVLGSSHVRYKHTLHKMLIDFFNKNSKYKYPLCIYNFKKIFSRYTQLRSSILTEDKINCLLKKLNRDLYLAVEDIINPNKEYKKYYADAIDHEMFLFDEEKHEIERVLDENFTAYLETEHFYFLSTIEDQEFCLWPVRNLKQDSSNELQNIFKIFYRKFVSKIIYDNLSPMQKQILNACTSNISLDNQDTLYLCKKQLTNKNNEQVLAQIQKTVTFLEYVGFISYDENLYYYNIFDFLIEMIVLYPQLLLYNNWNKIISIIENNIMGNYLTVQQQVINEIYKFIKNKFNTSLIAEDMITDINPLIFKITVNQTIMNQADYKYTFVRNIDFIQNPTYNSLYEYDSNLQYLAFCDMETILKYIDSLDISFCNV